MKVFWQEVIPELGYRGERDGVRLVSVKASMIEGSAHENQQEVHQTGGHGHRSGCLGSRCTCVGECGVPRDGGGRMDGSFLRGVWTPFRGWGLHPVALWSPTWGSVLWSGGPPQWLYTLF